MGISVPVLPHAEHGKNHVPLSLLDAAARANQDAVRLAIQSGADVNAEANGRTIVGCVIAGERWQEVDVSDASFSMPERLMILKELLNHNAISLYTLNAPQTAMRGATPLGIAAWLNLPEAVRLLLEERPGLVSVDGMDTLGATPLMYAARDGSIQVVQLLLAHSARPDYRDINHRTSIEHALRHPQALWLCESALRRHRARVTISEGNRKNLSNPCPELDELLAAVPRISCHPRFALKPHTEELVSKSEVLIQAVVSTDVQKLHSYLFSSVSSNSQSQAPPPFLINYPDSQGWSPIHHCVSLQRPSITVLDILFRAGADMSLYTRDGHGTPLHCLAFMAKPSTPPSIKGFIHHLVVDLRAPLSALNHERETCIHIAAEHGSNADVLIALLGCDTNGNVREMRNSRGLTAFEVARPEFKELFGINADMARSASPASVRTIKPSLASLQSVSSLAGSQLLAPHLQVVPSTSTSSPASPISERNYEGLSGDILENLRIISRQLEQDTDVPDFSSVDRLIKQTAEQGEDLVAQLSARVQEATEEFQGVVAKYGQANSLVDEAAKSVENRYGERFIAVEHTWEAQDNFRRRTTDSGESGTTAFSGTTSSVSYQASLLEKDGSISSVVSIPVVMVQAAEPLPRPEDIHIMTHHNPSPASLSVSTKNLRSAKSMADMTHDHTRLSPSVEENGFMKLVSPWMKELSRKTSRGDIKQSAAERSSMILTGSDKKDTGASKFKAWFKRKIKHETSGGIVMMKAVDSAGRPKRYGHARRSSSILLPQGPLLPASSGFCAAITIASKDLARIQESMEVAEEYIAMSKRSIAQAERLLKRALEHRKATLERARLLQQLADVSMGELSESPESIHHSLLRQDSIEFPPVTIPASARNSQLVFPRPPPSSKSSLISFSSTLIDDDDDDVRALHTLLKTKIDARTNAAFDEIEKVVTWLRIIREVARTLRRQTRA